jgi:hypothetical protein
MLLHKLSSGDQIMKDEMGEASGTYGRSIDMPAIYVCVAET